MEHSTPTPDSPPAGIDPAAAPANLSPAPEAAAPEEPDEEELEFGYAAPEYDPAQYRWVPVRRRQRSNGWTEEKQRRFIEVLADTGLVGMAAKEVGMTRMSAYRMRRAPYAAAFARAWDVARERAGTLIEDIAFERAIEGVEEDSYNRYGELADSKRVYNDRLLTFLLSHLKPERYSREARQLRAAWHASGGRAPVEVRGDAQGEVPGEAKAQAIEDAGRQPAEGTPALPELPAPGAPDITLADALRAMEPALPAPAEELLGRDELKMQLHCAELADGKLARWNSEQRPAKSPERLRQEALAAQIERGRIADEKQRRKETLSEAEWIDMCVYYDPSQGKVRRRPHARRVVREV